MAGIADEETEDEKDRGELKYQESKQFNSEWFICSAYDNTKSKRVFFEIYGLDTQDMFTMRYDYTAFDGLFRFNAELMNPNRKEGRFHWIIERLAIVTVNKKRELKLLPEPTDEVPELPIYETNRKIPTGRMDLKERQRLREQMDMLDIRRAENISKKRQATRQRVLQHIMRLKEEDVRRKEEVNKKIEEERKLRVKLKEEMELREREEEAKLEHMKKLRRKAVEVKEERTEEQDEEEYRQLRARWRVRDAEKAQVAADLRARKVKEHEDQLAAEQARAQQLEKVQRRRDAAHEAREARIKQKEAAKIKAVLEVKKERERKEKLAKERNTEYLQHLERERAPAFQAQLQHTEERRLAAEAEQEAYENYKERRAIPKKVKTKGSKARRDSKDSKDASASPTRPKGKSKSKSKGGEGKAVEGTDTEGAAGTDGERPEKPAAKGIDPEKVLDAVEAKMRKEMEEERKRQSLNKRREKKIEAKRQAWLARENEHNAQVRENYRQSVTLKEQAEVERRIVLQQKQAELQASEERRKAERERLERVRAANVLKREMARLSCATVVS